MIPLYIFAGIALIFQYLYYIYTNEVLKLRFWTYDPVTIFVNMLMVNLDYYSWFMSVWFLSALFLCEIIFFTLLHLVKSDKYRGLAVLLMVTTALIFFYNEYTPFFFASSLAGMVYYYLGFITKKHNLVSKLSAPRIVTLFVVFLLACSTPHAIAHYTPLNYDNIIQWYIGGIAGALFACSSMFYVYKYNIKFKTLEYLGKNSLTIMLINIPLIFGMSKIVDFSSYGIYSKPVLFTITIMVIISILYLVNIVFPYIIGLKRISRRSTAESGE